MSDQDLDDAIDRAVREMMSVEPGAATPARVLASIERPDRRAAPWMWAAAAATLVLVLAILVVRAPREEPPAIATQPERAAPRVVPPDEPPTAPEDSTRAPRSAPVVVRRAPERTVAGAVIPELPETIPALADIDPLVVPPPRATAIEPEEVVIPPLSAIPEIQFEALPFPLELRE